MKFYCNVMNCELGKPCNLKSCNFNVNYPLTLNCFLCYTSSQDSITLAEIAYLFNKPLKELKKTYKTILNKISCTAIKQEMKNKIEVNYIQNRQVCISCESKVENPVLLLDNYTICRECNVYPKKLWRLALENNVQITDIIKAVFKLFKNNTLIDNFLEASRGTAKKLEEFKGV
jgi:hypothetical protein